MPRNPWERIVDLADQIQKWADAKLGIQVIENMAKEILMQCGIIKEEDGDGK